MDKETSSRVSTLAAQIMRREHVPGTEQATLQSPDNLLTSNVISVDAYNDLLDEAKILAGSCMSQDETRGNDFRDRLEIERRELRERFTKLGAFIAKGTPGVTDPEQIDLLTTQHSIMEQYLRVLALRTGKLENDDAE